MIVPLGQAEGKEKRQNQRDCTIMMLFGPIIIQHIIQKYITNDRMLSPNLKQKQYIFLMERLERVCP